MTGVMWARTWAHYLALPALLVVAYAVFQPALSGPFVLDDQRIFSYGKAVLEQSWGERLADVEALINARPLSALAFRFEGHGLGSSPYPFKLNNLLLHLLNGCLVFLLVRVLARAFFSAREELDEGAAQRSFWWAVIATALWLIHPMQLSTMMTVIQRMTLLSGFWVLLAMLAYLWGRLRADRTALSYAAMTAAVVLGGGLAVLSKPNGALLVIYILAMEWTLLRSLPRPVGFRAWSAVFLVLPGLAILLILVLKAGPSANFDVVQRLLTEPRVIWSYLGDIFIPTTTSLGLYHDDFIVSQGWLEPPYTLWAILGLAVMLMLSIGLRKRQPLLAFAVFWYLGGHLLESTSLPLELYFEHRNYLPMLGLGVALGGYAVTSGGRGWLIFAVPAAFVALAMVSLNYAALWGSPSELASTWARNKPDSARAQLHLANYLFSQRRPDLSVQVLESASARLPRDAYLQFKALELRCAFKSPEEVGIKPLIDQAKQVRWRQPLAYSVVQVGAAVREGGCKAVSAESLLELVSAMAHSRAGHLKPQFAYFLSMEAMALAEHLGDLDKAWQASGWAQAAWDTPHVALHRARLALERGDNVLARIWWDKAQDQIDPSQPVAEPVARLLAELRPRFAD
ncbi:MAG: hypothetical protein ACPG4N_05720 [Gammaproteobacteria bacterium]